MAAAGRCLALSRRRSHERHVTDWVRAASPQAVPPRTTWLAGPVWDSARDLQNSLPAGRTNSAARLLHHISPQEPRPVGPRPGGVLSGLMRSFCGSLIRRAVTSELLLLRHHHVGLNRFATLVD